MKLGRTNRFPILQKGTNGALDESIFISSSRILKISFLQTRA